VLALAGKESVADVLAMGGAAMAAALWRSVAPAAFSTRHPMCAFRPPA